MSTPRSGPQSRARRRVLTAGAAVALAQALPVRAADVLLPDIRELKEYLAARVPQFGRLVLDLPRLADNGNAVPMRLSMTGPFAPGAELRSLRLYSEKNPVAMMARFDFPVPPAKPEIDSRVRLATTQRVVAIADLADGAIHAAVAEVAVTISACLDES